MSERLEELKKEVRIKKEVARLKRVLKYIDADKFKVAEGVIKRTAFMLIVLEDLEEDMNLKGTTEKFKQGDAPAYDRERPAARIYNSTIKNYTAACKQLFDFLPDGVKTDVIKDELLDFMKKGKS